MAKTSKSRKSQESLAAKTVNTQNIGARYRDYSPLLDGEDKQEFADFQLACVNAIQPGNAIEEVWVMDFVNYTWEAMRLRRLKIAVIHSNRKEAVQRLLEDHGEEYFSAKIVAEEWSAGDDGARIRVAQFLESRGLNDDAIAAIAFQRNIKDIESLDKLISSYDYRRDKAIRELEQRRDVLTRRAKALADRSQEAEFVDLSSGSAK